MKPKPVHTEVDPPSTGSGRDDLRVVRPVSARFHILHRFSAGAQEV